MANKNPNAVLKRVLKVINKWCVDYDIVITIDYHDLGERIKNLIYRLKNEQKDGKGK